MPRLLRCALLVRDADDPPIVDGGVLVADGRVAAAGLYADLRNAHPYAETLVRPGVVLPGFVDAHSHGRGLPREALDLAGAPLERFLVRLTAATSLDPRDDALLAAGRALATGITTVQPIYHAFTDPESCLEGARGVMAGYADAGAGCELVLGFTDRDEFLPPGLAAGAAPDRLARTLLDVPRKMDATDFLAIADVLMAAMPTAETRPHAGVTLGPVAPQWCTAPVLDGVAQRVSAGARAHVHLLETRAQARPGPDHPLAILRRHGLLSNRLSAGHCVWLNADGIRELAEREVVAVHNPGSNTRLESGAAPVRELLDAGATVALGLDSDATTDPPDVFADMRRARAIAGGRGRPISAREAFALATTGSAAALGQRGSLGTLRPGARADLLILRPPVPDRASGVLEALLDSADRDAITEVWVAGTPVVEAGRLLVEPAVERAASRLRAALDADAHERRRRMGAIAAIEPWALDAWAAVARETGER